MKNIKKGIPLILIAGCLFLPSAIRAEVMDKILVVVNDEVITQGELDRVLRPIYSQYSSLYGEEEAAVKVGEARKRILEQMIIDKLILNKAKREQIVVKDTEVKKEIDKLMKQFASEEGFEAALKAEGLTINNLEKSHRERIMINKLVEKEVRSKIKVTPIEVENYYNEHTEDFKAPLRVRARSILLKVKPDRNYEETMEFARKIHKRLGEGSDFAEVAKIYSDGPYAASGGDMGYIKKGDMIDRIDEVLFSLQEGEVSDILRTDLGFHIFKVEERKTSEIQDFNEVKDDIESSLYSQKFQKKFSNWVQELKNNAYIAVK